MVISKNNQYGTIGGGELEYRVTNESIKLLNNSNYIEKIIGNVQKYWISLIKIGFLWIFFDFLKVLLDFQGKPMKS